MVSEDPTWMPCLKWLGPSGGKFLVGRERIPNILAELSSPKTNMTMENPPFEDVVPIENRDFAMSC